MSERRALMLGGNEAVARIAHLVSELIAIRRLPRGRCAVGRSYALRPRPSVG
jgi:hypothetical protein